MAITKGNKKAALYKGDKHPAELYAGGTEVHHYTGKNLVRVSVQNMTMKNVYFKDIFLIAASELEPNTDYTLSFDVVSDVEPFYSTICPGDTAPRTDLKSTMTGTSGHKTITFSSADEKVKAYPNLYIRFVRYNVQTDFSFSVSNVQLERGSAETDYEPYCGGRETRTGKVTGYLTEEQSGKHMSFNRTYNGAFDKLSIYGCSEQKSSPESSESATGVESFEYHPVMDDDGFIRCKVDELKVYGMSSQESSPESSSQAEGVTRFEYQTVKDEIGIVRCVTDELKVYGRSFQETSPESSESATGVSRFEYQTVKDEDGMIRCVQDELKVYGRCEQQHYSGANLVSFDMDMYDVDQQYNGITLTRINSTHYHLSGTMEDGSRATSWAIGRFTLPTGKYGSFESWSESKSGAKGFLPTYRPKYRGNNNTVAWLTGANTRINDYDADLFEYIQVSVYCAANAYADGDAIDTDIFLMVSADETPTSYEPYVGGIASPNPDYPQEIMSVEHPSVTIRGKNHVDTRLGINTGNNGVPMYDLNPDGTVTCNGETTSTAYFFFGRDTFSSASSYFELTPGTYTLTVERLGGSADNTTIPSVSLAYYDESNVQVTILGVSVGTSRTVTIDRRRTNFFAYLRCSSGAVLHDLRVSVQLERSEESTAFEPYSLPQTVTLPYALNGIPVSSGGNVTIDGQQYLADYVDFVRGVHVQNVRRFDLPFSEMNNNDSYPGWVKLQQATDDYPMKNSSLSTIFGGSAFVNCCSLDTFGMNTNNVGALFFMPNHPCFKGMLQMDIAKKYAGKNCVVMYPLPAPIETELTEEEIFSRM